MHTISTRTPKPEERRLIAGWTKPDLASYGCITIAFGIGLPILLVTLAGWLGGLISADAAAYGQWLGGLVAAVAFVSVMVSFTAYDRRRRQRFARDHELQIVQEIHVAEPRVIEIGLVNDNEPILAFDIGENKILFLQGQWLRHNATYGSEIRQEDEDDSCDKFINGLPEPYSFPSSEFTVSRLPNSGEVLGIHVAGSYRAPQEVVEALKPEYEFGMSELLDGTLDEIAAVLAREHERRHAAITGR